MRLDKTEIRRIVREFPRGRGRAWSWVGCHDELIDAEVMDAVRRAWCADSEKPVTPTELVEFRAAIVAELAKKGFSL